MESRVEYDPQGPRVPHTCPGMIDPDTSVLAVLNMCSDVLNEKFILQELVEGCGHLLDKSPKYHVRLQASGLSIHGVRVNATSGISIIVTRLQSRPPTDFGH